MNTIDTEACGYCGSSDDPNDICKDCYDALSAPEEEYVSTHTDMCAEFWDRGLNCRCIGDGIKAAIRNGASPDDVM